jgi:hypothetical protein
MAKVIFRLNLQGKTPSTWSLPQSNVMSPKDEKGNKFIAYYPGEDSCFVEDIVAKNKDLRPADVPLFEYNVSSKQTELAVDEKNIALIRYLKTHPWFGIKYVIYSKDGQAKKDLTEFENVEKALELIKESDELKVQAISMAIFGLSSFNKSYTQCAAELKAKAIREPLVIIQAMEATNYETKYVSGLAFVSKIIKLNPTHTAIVWADSSEGVILHIAQGENGLDKLTNFLTNETKEAQVLLQEFNSRLERKERMVARSEDVDKALSEKDAEIAELKRQLTEANAVKVEAPEVTESKEDATDEIPKDGKSILEQLQEDYKLKFNSEVPIRYKNDEVWIAKKLAE